jgi:hypothetical protein
MIFSENRCTLFRIMLWPGQQKSDFVNGFTGGLRLSWFAPNRENRSAR